MKRTPLAASASLMLVFQSPPAVPVPSTWTLAELEAAARTIQRELEVLRGTQPAPPFAVALVSADRMRELVDQQQARTTTPERLAADLDVARMLGLVPHDCDVAAVAQRLASARAFALYDEPTRTVRVRERCPVALAKVALARELARALDAANIDLANAREKAGTDTDACLALRALVDGSAALLADRWQKAHAEALDAESERELAEAARQEAQDSPAWVWRSAIAPALLGARFLERQDDWLTDQTGSARAGDIARAFGEPPRSMEMMLHPGAYWDERRFDPPTKVGYEVAELPVGWRVLREDTLGEFVCALVATSPDSRGGLRNATGSALDALHFTNEAATGWDGDRLVLVGREQARVLQWTTVWDRQADADEFLAVLSKQFDHLERSVEHLTGERDLAYGVVMQPGARSDEIVLTVFHGVPHAELSALSNALGFYRPKTH
ncbi:MAG: hypothetical protein IT454_19225 [Planctomycetes bacterium]|nr:hypothetical protein [Planctomycetota bacterium]